LCLVKKNSSIIGAPIRPETSYWSRTKEKLQTIIILVAPELWCIIKWSQRNLNTHGGEIKYDHISYKKIMRIISTNSANNGIKESDNGTWKEDFLIALNNEPPNTPKM